MSYRISGLNPDPFLPLFELPDEVLAARGARRVTAREKPGYPCRVSLEDAEPGEGLLLLNFEHQPARSPFRASHAIYVRRAATRPFEARNRLPPVFHGRILSLRGFSPDGMLLSADLAEGADAESAIERLFGDPEVAYLHAHSAKPGCFLARVDRLPG